MSVEEIILTDEELDEQKKKKKLSKIEKKKLRVINRLIAGEINGPKAAQLLKITTRQVRNLKRQVLNEGIEGVVHKNKYNKPINTYEDEIRQQVTSLYRKQYKGVNFSQYAIILKEEHGLDLSRSTVYNMLRKGRIRSPQRKKKKRTKPQTETTDVVTKTTKKSVKVKESV